MVEMASQDAATSARGDSEQQHEAPVSGAREETVDGDAIASEQLMRESAPAASETAPDAKPETTDSDVADASDCYRLAFSAAQVRVKEQQARLEAKIAADDEMLALRKQIIELEHEKQALERSNAQSTERLELFQKSVDAVTSAHKRTLSGMRDDLQLPSLVAALESEKATRAQLETAFATQNAALLTATERIASLSAQVRKYQTTETVLAQSIAHFQHRVESKDAQRVASIERIKRECDAAHAHETATLREALAAATRAEQVAQEQLLATQTALDALQASAQDATSRERAQESEVETLRTQVETLETDNAVLVRKAEQLQRADAQLRSRVKSLDDELAVERAQTLALRDEVAELTKIASDLMEMAEKHQSETRRTGAARDSDDAFLASRKKRLRMSIG